MTNDNKESETHVVNPGYALRQLARALFRGATAGGAARATQWRQVIAGMLDGSLQVGDRTPVQGTPAWVTLNVVHGGFATGSLAASGPLAPHETEKLAALGGAERLDLNLHFTSEAGREELLALLGDGRYRVHLPEEGALLMATWLLKSGEVERAETLLQSLAPFFDRLRFYPVPHQRPSSRGTGVYRWTVGQSIAALEKQRPQPELAKMIEAVQVWAPLYDRTVALFLETVEGPVPQMVGRARTDVQPTVSGGWPVRTFPVGWRASASALLKDYRAARAVHTLCGKPERKKENFCRLRGYLATCLEDPGRLSGREVGQIRKILAGYVSRRGTPASEPLSDLRRRQVQDVEGPSYAVLAQVLVGRLAELPVDEGSAEAISKLGPLTEDEAVAVGGQVGRCLPSHLVRRAQLCWEAPVETLIEKGLLRSSESLATVLPMMTARVKAEAISDPELARAFEAVYLAFRRRRSLLLLCFQSQVRLEELPWIAAVSPWLGGDQQAKRDALEVLRRLSALALGSFPQTILPNKLVKELRGLASDADQKQPFVDELAADIFMGGFTANFVKAAKIAAGLLEGTAYESYYGLSYRDVAGLDDGTKDAGIAFSALCRERVGWRNAPGFSAAYNGTVIEQSQILTTHNLAVLFGPLGLRERLGGSLPGLARRCFEVICQRQSLSMPNWRAQMQTVKDSAYAWRQMLFYLSLEGERGMEEFLPWARHHLSSRDGAFRERFEPVMAGLEAVVGGGRFDQQGLHPPSGGRRFLGWTTERHWLLPHRESAS
jgi:hypothetical protein